MTHIFAQSTALPRLIWTAVACTSEFTLPKHFASSAKTFMHAMITYGMSFLYIRNNIRTNTLPRGIPLVAFASHDLFFKNYFIQLDVIASNVDLVGACVGLYQTLWIISTSLLESRVSVNSSICSRS